MTTDVTELVVVERPTAVIARTTTWDEYPALWGQLLDAVWKAVRSDSRIVPGRNVMLYKDDRPSVEVGVEVADPFAPIGEVVCSALPGGRVLTTTHRGPTDELLDGLAHAHDTVARECDRRGLRRLGPLWEIYGHWTETSVDQEVEIYHLVG